jgi:hypothetical protein
MRKFFFIFIITILLLINGCRKQEEIIVNENEIDVVKEQDDIKENKNEADLDEEEANDSFKYSFELNENDIKEDIFNSDKIRFINIYHLSKDDCKNFIFKTKEIDEKHVEVIVDFKFEYICIGGGRYNEEFQRYADVKHYFSPIITMTYTYNDDKWELNKISQNDIYPVEKTEEIEITSNYIEFNRDIGMIKEDLSDIISKPYFRVKNGFNPITFVKDENKYSDFNKGYILIDKINSMDITEVKLNLDDKYQYKVTISLDVCAENINIIGEAELLYRLWNDEYGNPYWRLKEINQDNNNFEISSIVEDNKFKQKEEISNTISAELIESLLEQRSKAESLFIEGVGIDFQKDSIRLGEYHKIYNDEFRSYDDIRNYLLNIFTDGQHLENFMTRIKKTIIEKEDGYLYMSPGNIKTGLNSITDEYIIKEIDDEKQIVIFSFYKTEKNEYTNEIVYRGPFDIKLKYDIDYGWRLDDWIDLY